MADSKSTADVLLELIYSWIEQRELCAQQLRKLAKELEGLREKCNASEIVGNSVSVVGAATLIGAGFATLLTGGAAAPLIGLGAAYTGVGATISVVTKITEHFLSSSTLKDAQKIEKKSDEIADKIQRLFQQLREEIKKMTSLTDEDEDEDEVERHVMNRILGAMARRSLQHKLIDFSYNDLRFITGRMSQFCFGAGASQLSNISGKSAATAVIAISALFILVANRRNMKRLAKKGTDQLLKAVSTAGFKTGLKGVTMVVGGAVGLGFALNEAIDSWREMIKNNHVTEASQSLRDTADAIVNMTQTLREQLDTMSSSCRETLRVFAEMLRCIEDSNRSSEEKRKMRAFVLKMFEHEDFMEWLRGHLEPESIKSRCQTFLKLIDKFNFLKQALDEEKEKLVNKDNIHITFVAHGSIEQEMIPANTLLPLHTIKDVVVYSPWNCAINADVAYGIAKGTIEPQHRLFRCTEEDACQIPDEGHRPTNLPNHWNSMKTAAAKRQMIPNILVSPLRKPKDGAWERFMFLQEKHGRPGINRIVIPFILPDEWDDDVSRVPFSVVITTLSQVLKSSGYRATVHLAACLGKRSARTNLHEGYLKEQYACTINNTAMITSDEMLIDRESDLYRALRDLFG
ncbi:hypothetical protein ABVT39_018566 [Epinephelus coioides]